MGRKGVQDGKGEMGVVGVQGGVEGWEGIFLEGDSLGVWWGEKRVSGLRGQRVDLSME